jgi:hypothetical protein
MNLDQQTKLQKLERRVAKLETQMLVAIECLDKYRTLVIEDKNGRMFRLGKHAEEALNLMGAINNKGENHERD